MDAFPCMNVFVNMLFRMVDKFHCAPAECPTAFEALVAMPFVLSFVVVTVNALLGDEDFAQKTVVNSQTQVGFLLDEGVKLLLMFTKLICSIGSIVAVGTL